MLCLGDRRLEEFDRVARRIFHEDLFAANAGDDLVAEPDSVFAQARDGRLDAVVDPSPAEHATEMLRQRALRDPHTGRVMRLRRRRVVLLEREASQVRGAYRGAMSDLPVPRRGVDVETVASTSTYRELVDRLKQRIRESQARAARALNTELVMLY